MSLSVERILKDAMNLPAESRVRLVDLLVESLEGDDLSEIDKVWAIEAERRRTEIASGAVDPVPGETGLARVRESLRR